MLLFFKKAWETESLPTWQDNISLPIHKKRRLHGLCGVTCFPTIRFMVYARIVEDRLKGKW